MDLLDNASPDDSPDNMGSLSFKCDLCFARDKKRKQIEDIFCVVCGKNQGMMKVDQPDMDELLSS